MSTRPFSGSFSKTNRMSASAASTGFECFTTFHCRHGVNSFILRYVPPRRPIPCSTTSRTFAYRNLLISFEIIRRRLSLKRRRFTRSSLTSGRPFASSTTCFTTSHISNGPSTTRIALRASRASLSGGRVTNAAVSAVAGPVCPSTSGSFMRSPSAFIVAL